jgi:hypothetical protein
MSHMTVTFTSNTVRSSILCSHQCLQRRTFSLSGCKHLAVANLFVCIWEEMSTSCNVIDVTRMQVKGSIWGWGFRSRGMWPVVLGDGSLTFQTNAVPSSSRILLDCYSLKVLQCQKHVGTSSPNNTVPHPSRPECWTALLWEITISHILISHASDLQRLMSSRMSDVFGILMMCYTNLLLLSSGQKRHVQSPTLKPVRVSYSI